jgi:hypothetical protein
MPVDVTLIARKMRFVVVHYHIFKNAGTTVERILEREFPASFARLHGPTSDCTLDSEDLASFLEDHPAIQAVTSHHLRYPAPQLRNIVVFDCCFLRHPLDRLDSLYSYFRKIDSTDPLCRNAHRLNAADFVRDLRDRSPEHISDVQVTYLANRGAFTRPANADDLDRAMRMVQNMALPGVVEMFEESMVAAEYFMRPAFPSIRLGSGPANVSRPRLSSEGDRERRLIDLWGGNLYDELARANEFDIGLYDFACREVRRRLDLIPAATDRIAEFGNRCEEVAAITRA